MQRWQCWVGVLSFGLFSGCNDPQPVVGVGEDCSTGATCVSGTRCFITQNDNEAICMEECTEEDRICDEGEPCISNEEGTTYVCYIGGTVPIGDECEDTPECDRGVCVEVGEESRCYQACEVGDDEPCTGEESCQPTADTGEGYCDEDP